MKSLVTLIKLQKNRVDEQRLMVAKLQEQLARVDADILAHQQEMEAQRVLVHEHPEMALTYGDYVKLSLKKEAFLQRKRRTAEMAVNLALDKLAELFEEQKRYEIAETNRKEEEARVEAHKERLFLDEVGSVAFVRKSKEK